MNLLLMRRCIVKNNNKEWRVILHSFHNNQMKTDFCDKSHNVGWYKRKGLGALVWPITFNRIVEKNWSLLSSLAGVNSSYRTVHAMNVYMDLGIASVNTIIEFLHSCEQIDSNVRYSEIWIGNWSTFLWPTFKIEKVIILNEKKKKKEE